MVTSLIFPTMVVSPRLCGVAKNRNKSNTALCEVKQTKHFSPTFYSYLNVWVFKQSTTRINNSFI